VKEEILSREAVKLGLDQNDTVIRRRLQQKMEFVAEDFAATSEPTDAELADYFANNLVRPFTWTASQGPRSMCSSVSRD